MNNKNKYLKSLYKKYSKDSLINLEIRRKIKTHIYKEKLEQDINFIINAKKYIDSLKQDIVDNKTQLEIENTMRKVLKNKDFIFMSSPVHLKRCNENIIQLNNKIREIEMHYSYMHPNRKGIVFRELKNRGYKIINILE